MVVASSDFEPNNWLNLLAIPDPDEDEDEELELDDEPSKLPPPQPDRAELAITTRTIPAVRFKRLPAIVLPLHPLIQRGAL